VRGNILDEWKINFPILVFFDDDKIFGNNMNGNNYEMGIFGWVFAWDSGGDWIGIYF
jgi:hypothetical protein